MEYYTATQLSRKLGISNPVLKEMIRNKEIKATRKNGGPYRIPKSEVQRLEKKLEEDERKLNDEFGIEGKDIRYYTVSEVAKKLGLPRTKVVSFVKTGKVKAIKGKYQRSPYLIAETEFPKFFDRLPEGEKNREISSNSNTEIESRISPESCNALCTAHYEQLLGIQKTLVETMNGLAVTQEHIALALRELIKKV